MIKNQTLNKHLKCENCGEYFPNDGALQMHIRASHKQNSDIEIEEENISTIDHINAFLRKKK